MLYSNYNFVFWTQSEISSSTFLAFFAFFTLPFFDEFFFCPAGALTAPVTLPTAFFIDLKNYMRMNGRAIFHKAHSSNLLSDSRNIFVELLLIQTTEIKDDEEVQQNLTPIQKTDTRRAFTRRLQLKNNDEYWRTRREQRIINNNNILKYSTLTIRTPRTIPATPTV